MPEATEEKEKKTVRVNKNVRHNFTLKEAVFQQLTSINDLAAINSTSFLLRSVSLNGLSISISISISISCLYSVIVRVRVVLKPTIVGYLVITVLLKTTHNQTST